MALQITLPFGKKDNTKNLIFSILIYDHPLKIIEITNLLHKRYGKSVTFQTVREAVLELVQEQVLTRTNKEFQINKAWIKDSITVLNDINAIINKQKSRKMDSLGGDVTVVEFDSLAELMKYSEEFIDDWYRNFKKGDHPVNCYQGEHYWEALLYPDKEQEIINKLKKKGIKSYSLMTSNTVLDRNIEKFYRTMRLNVVNRPSTSRFDRSYYVATYSDIIAETRYPEELVHALDKFFKKNKKLEDLDLHELSSIVNKKIRMKITIIKNLEMAKQINNSIIAQINE
jgi:hypothetical protein